MTVLPPCVVSGQTLAEISMDEVEGASTRQVTVKRDIWWDVVKGEAILLIVAGHVLGALHYERRVEWFGTRKLVDAMLLGALAAFYIAAGAFLPNSSRRSFGNFILAKVRTLMVPYVCWTLFQGGTETLLARFVVPDRSFSALLRTLWYDPYWQFWFLYVLFLASLLAWPIVRSRVPRWCIVCVALTMRIATHFGLTTGWSVADRALADFVFVAIGIAYGPTVARSLTRLPAGIVAFLWAIAIGVAAVLGTKFDLEPAWTIVTLLVAVAIGGSATLAKQSEIVQNLLSYIGQRSMAIYMMHVLVIGGVKVITVHALPHASFPAHLALRLIPGVGLPLLAVMFWHRVRVWANGRLARPVTI